MSVQYNKNKVWKNIFGLSFGFLTILLSILPIIFLSNTHGQNITLSITAPQDDAQVCWRTMVKGTVSAPKLQVFVAIHPMATDKVYIQRIPTVSSDGKWSAYCYFGEKNQGINEPFEIIAIASKNKKLYKEQDILPSPLPDNPQIVVRSNPVIVKRAPCLQ